MPLIIQNDFTAGEFSPLMEGRTDVQKYGSSVKQMRNMIAFPQGPATRRPGLRFIAPAKYGDKVCRIAAFNFNTEQAYIIEFGDKYIRFYRNQGQIIVSETDSTPYEIASPYSEADLTLLKCNVQSADVLYLFHPLYIPHQLTRTGHTDWTMAPMDFKPPATSTQADKPNVGITLDSLTGKGVTVTADADYFLMGDVSRFIKYDGGVAIIRNVMSPSIVQVDVSEPFKTTGPFDSGSWTLEGSPTGAIQPSDTGPAGAAVSVTGDTHGGRINLISSDPAGDWWEASASNGAWYLKTSATGFQDNKPAYVYISDKRRPERDLGKLTEFSWGWGDNDSLGYSTIYIKDVAGDNPDSRAGKHYDYIQCSGSLEVFRDTDVGKFLLINGGAIRIDTVNGPQSIDGVILSALDSADAAELYTLETSAWSDIKGYPTCGTFYGDRLILAGSSDKPQTIWGSVVGDYTNFTEGAKDAQAIEFNIPGRDVNCIQWIEAGQKLLIGTSSSEWAIGSDDTGTPLTPTNISGSQKPQTHYGGINLPPIGADRSTLFVQHHGRKLREFTFQWAMNGYTAPDLSELAEHMTLSGIVGMAYQQEPFSIIWAVTADGRLIGLTYLRAENVIGWHQHPMSGFVESIATIPGDGYDEVWVSVRRTINGQTVRYIEMLEKLYMDDNDTFVANKGLNAFFVDSGLTYNGEPATVIGGLSHLEGETVSILADGGVRAVQTVSGGQITLDRAASVVHVGLPYTSTLGTMRIDVNLQDGTAQGRRKRISQMSMRVLNSGPFMVGRDAYHLEQVPIPEWEMTAPPEVEGITLSWELNSDSETSVRVDYKTDTLTDWTLLKTLDAGATTTFAATSDGLDFTKAIYFSIVSTNSSGDSERSDTITYAPVGN